MDIKIIIRRSINYVLAVISNLIYLFKIYELIVLYIYKSHFEILYTIVFKCHRISKLKKYRDFFKDIIISIL